MKVKIWKSDDGQMFEGSAAQLIKEHGIKHKRSLYRESGGLDRDGNRWLDEDTFNVQNGVQKPQLFLGNRPDYQWNSHKEKYQLTYHCPSETADVYLICKRLLEEEDFNAFSQEELVNSIKKVEAQYNIVENNPPATFPEYDRVVRVKDKVNKERRHWVSEKNWGERHWNRGPWTEAKQARLDTLQRRYNKVHKMYIVEMGKKRKAEMVAHNNAIKAQVERSIEKRLKREASENAS